MRARDGRRRTAIPVLALLLGLLLVSPMTAPPTAASPVAAAPTATGATTPSDLSLPARPAAPTAQPGAPAALPEAGAPTRAGSVVSSSPLRAALPGRATRVLYRSTDVRGAPNVVSGTVVEPLTPPVGPRRLIGYAVGTQGLADRCAPSRQFEAGTEYETPFVSALLARGYTVAISDYEGLGTPGEHTYVIRAAQAHAVLDAVRAARALGAAPADGPVALAGYSQGGGASAAAAELAPDYAPDIDLVGAYAGSVPADLAAVGEFLDGRPAAGLLTYALNGFRAAYPDLPIDEALNARGRAVLAEARDQCVQDTVARYPGLRTATLTRDGRALSDLLAEEPFRTRVEEQRLGNGRAPEVPTLMVHSVADDVVPFDQGRALAQRWCAQGADVQFLPSPVPTHVGAAPAAFTTALGFLEARFAGRPTPSTC